MTNIEKLREAFKIRHTIEITILIIVLMAAHLYAESVVEDIDANVTGLDQLIEEYHKMQHKYQMIALVSFTALCCMILLDPLFSVVDKIGTHELKLITAGIIGILIVAILVFHGFVSYFDFSLETEIENKIKAHVNKMDCTEMKDFYFSIEGFPKSYVKDRALILC